MAKLTRPTLTAIALALAAAAPAKAADTAQQAQALGMEEIIVNARRVEENLQRVPIAVAAFTAESLQRQDIKDVYTLTKNVGGINISGNPASSAFIFLRGIQGVVFYLADAPVDVNTYGN